MQNRIVRSLLAVIAAILSVTISVHVTIADSPDDNKPDLAKAHLSVSIAGSSKETSAAKGPAITVAEGFQPDSLTSHRPEGASGLEFFPRRVKDNSLSPDYVFGAD